MGSKPTVIIITPPVTSPVEPPAGGYLFAGILAGRRIPVKYYDANLDYYYFLLDHARPKGLKCWDFIRRHPHYSSAVYQSRTGVIEQEIKYLLKSFPGWQITLNHADYAPISAHHPQAWADYLRSSTSPVTPFTSYIHHRLLPYILDQPESIIGISVSFLPQLYFAIELAIRLQSLGITPVIGGCLLKSYRKYHPALPAIFSELFSLPAEGDRFEFAGEWFDTQTDLNMIRFPETVIPLDHYLAPQIVMPLMTSKGCYYSRCRFCPEQETRFSMIEAPSLESFMQETERHFPDQSILYHFIDSAIPPSFIRRNIHSGPSTRRYYGFVRFEADFLEAGLIKAMHYSGWEMLQWGLESASPSILERFRKGIRLENVIPILSESARYGIRNFLYLLMGLPGETESDRMASLLFLKQNPQIYHFLNLSIFNLPDQPDIDSLCRDWNIQLENLTRYQGDFSFYRPWREQHGIPRIQARQFINQQMMSDTHIRAKIKDTPVPLKSDHAPFIQVSS
ncbi:MAG: hypothetical protein KBA26_02915 [Candidatus Delongbacteria bacterium]|nr:hypothetical protein [Candidatus Delongbacteria bacterium]